MYTFYTVNCRSIGIVRIRTGYVQCAACNGRDDSAQEVISVDRTGDVLGVCISFRAHFALRAILPLRHVHATLACHRSDFRRSTKRGGVIG